mgnify:CR=1 FL=1
MPSRVVGQRHAGSRCLCVVDKHLNAAEGLHGLLHNVLHGGLIVTTCTDICLHRQDLDTIKLLQFILGFFQLFHVAACDNQIGSFFGVGGGNAIADGATAAILQNSTPCAGDECSFSC